MTVKHETLSLNTTAKNLIGTAIDKSGKNYAGSTSRTMALTNVGTVSAFIGGEGVTAANHGFELKAGASMSFDLNPDDVLFAVVASGTGSVRVLHTGV